MRSFALAAFTAVMLSTSAIAAAPEIVPPTTDISKTPSGTYLLDPGHANVLFSLSHLGYSNYYGRFNKLDGKLNFDAKAPEKSTISFTVDIASIDTNHSELQGKLKSADWFDAAKYTTATFTSTKIEKTSATTGKLTGDLTLHGITKPVTFDVVFNGAGVNPFSKKDQLGFSAKGKIKRSDFGISAYVPAVGDEVTLTIETEFQLAK